MAHQTGAWCNRQQELLHRVLGGDRHRPVDSSEHPRHQLLLVGTLMDTHRRLAWRRQDIVMNERVKAGSTSLALRAAAHRSSRAGVPCPVATLVLTSNHAVAHAAGADWPSRERRSNMILVTGATSNVGSELVSLLRRRGSSVRALVHAARNIDWPGVDVAFTDLTDPLTLDHALEGKSICLISPPPPRERHVQMEHNLIDAAARAGVRRVVKQSVLDSDPEMPVGSMRSHHACEHPLRVLAHG